MADYSFPYEPYPIQRQLMDVLYSTLEQGQLAILESPTGTGKSLSTICAAMTWLEAKNAADVEDLERTMRRLADQIKMADEDDDWMNAHGRKLKYQKQLDETQTKADYRRRVEERVRKAKQNARLAKQKTTFPVSTKRKAITSADNDDDLLLPDLDNDDLLVNVSGKADADNDLLPLDFDNGGGRRVNDENNESEAKRSQEEEERLRCTKIIYASRTHSQLEQFAAELRKTRFRPRVLTVGGRQLLCVNEAVRALRNSALINDRCNELHDTKSTARGKRAKDGDGTARSSRCGCEFAKADAIESLTDEILTHDVTASVDSPNGWLPAAGRRSVACPYFAARSASALCELVLVPYNVLLHKATRETWNLDLKDNIVIVDEAHNLLQTLASIHSCELDEQQLTACCSLIAEYIDRFASRLSPRNLLYVRHLRTVAGRLLAVLRADNSGEADNVKSGADSNEAIFTLPRFMAMLDCMDIDLFKLIDYLESSNLCRKLRDFNLRYAGGVMSQQRVIADENRPPKKSVEEPPGAESSMASRFAKFLQKPVAAASIPMSTKSKPKGAAVTASKPDQFVTQSDAVSQSLRSSTPLYQLKEFLEALTTRAEDARILIQRPTTALKSGRYRFLLLNAAEKLRDIVVEARSLVLIGGTMRPVDQLLDAFERVCGVDRRRIVQFTCGHIIDDAQLVALAVGRGPSRMDLRLSFAQRGAPLMAEIGRAFVNMLRHVPHGVVVFFPSYAFLGEFVAAIRAAGHFQQLNEVKPIFLEARNSTTNSSVKPSLDVWLKFRKTAPVGRGALLFAVIGGSLSEGINFSDELGRCVIVVGMPYPNKNSLELLERMKYVDQTIGNEAGARLYESLCVHAVNQAIGRAIRHRNDYAAIVLMDARYLRKSVADQLPGWICKRSANCEMFHEALAKLIAFFRDKKSQNETIK